MESKAENKLNEKQTYVKPTIEIIEMETQNSVLAGSYNAPGFGDDGGAW